MALLCIATSLDWLRLTDIHWMGEGRGRGKIDGCEWKSEGWVEVREDDWWDE